MAMVRIGISWRDDGQGKGAFWDHYTLRRLFPECETYIITHESQQEEIDTMRNYIQSNFPNISNEDITLAKDQKTCLKSLKDI